MEFTKEEIQDFKEEWGQSHEEVCACLGYDPDGSDDLLKEDYFWNENDQKWYNKESSFFSEREQEIADYLRGV